MPVAARSAGTRRERGEGQWALGYREPLNTNERKQEGRRRAQRPPADHRHLQQGTASTRIDPADLRGRFRWYGLYTQRRPGIGGGKTAIARAGGTRRPVLHAADPHRRWRARRASSCASSPTSRRRYGRGTAPTSPTGRTSSCTGSEIEDVPAIWDEARGGGPVHDRGVRRHPAGDTGLPARRRRRRRGPRRRPPRSRDRAQYVGDPGVLQPAPQVQDLDHAAAPAHCTVHEINDVVVRRRGQRPGRHRVTTCGSAAACRRTRCSAKRLGVFVRPDQVPRGVGRGDVAVPRLRLPPPAQPGAAEVPGRRLGAEKFREVLEKEYLGYALPDGPAPAARATAHATTSVSTRRTTGLFTSASRPSAADCPATRWT